ncbi:DUF91 domain-containing protein [bacterium]|nr:DUF91 domain-containing protein [bacterium]
MRDNDKPPVWKMIREAVEALGGKTANVAVRHWVLQRYPGTNPATIQCQIVSCTVNHPSRIHYPQNKKPRMSNTHYDFLFRTDRGHLELYNASKHGQWEIFQREDGRPGVGLLGQEEELAEAETGAAFAAEAHLRDYLAQHLDQVEPGLQLFVDEDGNDGVEYRTAVGRIDILAVDGNGGFVVIELKVSHGPDSAAGQVLRYKNWVKKHLAEDVPVRGIVIAQHISDKLLYAIASDADVSAKEYELSLTITDVGRIQ